MMRRLGARAAGSVQPLDPAPSLLRFSSCAPAPTLPRRDPRPRFRAPANRRPGAPPTQSIPTRPLALARLRRRALTWW